MRLHRRKLTNVKQTKKIEKFFVIKSYAHSRHSRCRKLTIKKKTANSIVSNLLVLICVKRENMKQKKMGKVEVETSFSCQIFSQGNDMGKVFSLTSLLLFFLIQLVERHKLPCNLAHLTVLQCFG